MRGFEVYTYNTWQRNWMSLDLIGSFGLDQNKTFEDIIKGSMKWIKAHFIDKRITKINQKNHALVLFLILSSFAFPHFPISGLLLFQLFKAHFNDYKDNEDVTRRHMDIICEASGAELKEWDTKKTNKYYQRNTISILYWRDNNLRELWPQVNKIITSCIKDLPRFGAMSPLYVKLHHSRRWVMLVWLTDTMQIAKEDPVTVCLNLKGQDAWYDFDIAVIPANRCASFSITLK